MPKLRTIPIAKILFSKWEENAVLKVLRSGQIANGPEVEKFEKAFAKYIGTKYAIAVNSGTSAIVLSLLSLGLKPKDEIITTPFSFHTTIGAILYVGAKPIFVDIKEDFNIDERKIEEKITSKTRAILPVHLFGNPCEIVMIESITRKHNLSIIEDTAQAHGASFEGKKVGSFGDFGCFSFYATKNMTTGEGGMITTNNRKLADKAKFLRSDQLNFRMTEIQAAIGGAQLKKLDRFNQKRIRNAHYLTLLLKDIKGIIPPTVEKSKIHVFHQYTIRVKKIFPMNRNYLREALAKKGINTAVYYPKPLENLPRAKAASEEVLSLPIHPRVTKRDLEYIAGNIKTFSLKSI